MTEKAKRMQKYLARYGECKRELEIWEGDLEEIERIIREDVGFLWGWLDFNPMAEGKIREVEGKWRAEQERICQKIREAETLMQTIRETVEAMPEGAARDIIKARYIDGLKWDRIIEAVSYCPEQCYKIHRTALQQLAEALSQGGSDH